MAWNETFSGESCFKRVICNEGMSVLHCSLYGILLLWYAAAVVERGKKVNKEYHCVMQFHTSYNLNVAFEKFEKE